jgi:hypothetical protein
VNYLVLVFNAKVVPLSLSHYFENVVGDDVFLVVPFLLSVARLVLSFETDR